MASKAGTKVAAKHAKLLSSLRIHVFAIRKTP